MYHMVVRLILLQHNAFQGDKKNVIPSAHFCTADFLCGVGVQLTCIHRRCHHSLLVTPRQGGGPPSLSLWVGGGGWGAQKTDISSPLLKSSNFIRRHNTFSLYCWDTKSFVMLQIQITRKVFNICTLFTININATNQF